MAISRIPSGVLQEIFYQSLSYDPRKISGPISSIPKVSEPPLSLTMVCRSWRNLSISCPRLWTSICVNTARHTDPMADDFQQAQREYAQLEAGVEQWLNRSKSLPLKIQYEGEFSPAPELSSRLSEIFVAVAPRWAHIRIGALDTLYILLDCLSSGVRMPHLRRLNFLPVAALFHLTLISLV